MRFLRDQKRICWLEIYLKVFASSEPPLLCQLCGQYYTLSQSGMCFYHPKPSVYDRLRGIRHYPCCQNDFYFSTLVCDGVQPNLMDHTLSIGCKNRFHKPYPKDHKPDYNLLVPQKYIVVKDDTPGFYLNTEMYEESKDIPRTLPKGYDYEVPMSLNAETCLSEYRQKVKEESKE